jgi:hypothetical protein
MTRSDTRRGHLIAGAAAALTSLTGGAALGRPMQSAVMTVLDPPLEPGVTLLSAPIELAGDWGRMIPSAADTVVERMRRASLGGVRLLSDRQPTRLRVDEHTSGAPAVWLHPDGSTTAWVIVDIGQQAWSQLAYQFGHELGHVFANSWQAHAKPGGACQWLEEALVEAFSLRGLGRLAPDWKAQPPFANDNAYGDAIAGYRANVVNECRRLAAEQGGLDDLRAWYQRHQRGIEAGDGLNLFARAAAGTLILDAYEQGADAVEGVGALNRWPGRTHVSLADYLHGWEASCVELGASPALPAMLKARLRL